MALYDRTIRPLASAWAARKGLAQIRLITETSPPIDETVLEDLIMVDPEKPVLTHSESSAGVVKLIDFYNGRQTAPLCSTNVIASSTTEG